MRHTFSFASVAAVVCAALMLILAAGLLSATERDQEPTATADLFLTLSAEAVAPAVLPPLTRVAEPSTMTVSRINDFDTNAAALPTEAPVAVRTEHRTLPSPPERMRKRLNGDARTVLAQRYRQPAAARIT